MLKVSKILLLSVLVVALCSPMALATTSRVQALAGASNYINDDSDIFRWYGTLPSYANMVMAEVGQASGAGDVTANHQALGFTFEFGDEHWMGTWAIFLLKNSIEDGSYYLFNPLGTPGELGGLALPSTKFALAWGEQFERFSLGVQFTRSDVEVEVPAVAPATGTWKNDYNVWTLGAGARWDISESTYGDVAITLGGAGGDTLGGFDKKTTWDIEARVFYEFKDNATVVPYFRYSKAEFALEGAAAPTGSNVDDLVLGASLNFDVNTNNMLIFAAEFENFKWKYSKNNDNALPDADQSEVKVTVLPKFYVGLESDVTSWFTARVGATKTMASIKQTDAAGNESKYTNTEVWPDALEDDFSWYLGAGFHIAEWDIDALFSPDVPFRMGYWLTGYGADDPDPPVTRVSATYRF